MGLIRATHHTYVKPSYFDMLDQYTDAFIELAQEENVRILSRRTPRDPVAVHTGRCRAGMRRLLPFRHPGYIPKPLILRHPLRKEFFCMTTKLTYWNNHGKHQKQADELGKLVPDFGYTSNENLNLYITISNLYYDAYNNGGCNVLDCYAKDFNRYVVPLLPDVCLDAFAECREREIEGYVDRALEYLAGKDFSCQLYLVFYNYDEEKMSLEEQDGPGWKSVSFGSEVERDKWLNNMVAHGIRKI